MSNEEKNVNELKDEKCFCQNKSFRKFLTIALGTFVGVYAALSLFAAVHRPPMMPPAFVGYRPMPCPCVHNHHPHFTHGMKGDFGSFHKEFKGHKGAGPFVPDRPQEKD